MKMLKRSLLAAACVMVMANTAFAAPQAAAVPEQTAQTIDQQAVLPEVNRDTLFTSGTITEINGDKITVKGEGMYKLVTVCVGDNTYIVDGKKGKLKDFDKLKVGKEVTVYYSSKMTRSYPPQAEGFAVVLGEHTEKQGKFFKVDKVMPGEDGNSVKVLNSNHDVIATITKDVCKKFAEIKEGDNLLLWYDIMTMSLPGQTNAYKAVILPELK